MTYIVPNRAVANTIIASNPINENWNEIQTALNNLDALAIQVDNKVDKDSLGAINGVATLDSNAKLNISQLPDSARSSVFEVNSLYEQLSLNAHIGDICVRKDVNKTFCLGDDDPAVFSNWVEISSVNAGGEVGGNPCFTTTISINGWTQSSTGNYFKVFNNDEHGQGNTRFLLVDIKRIDGEDIICHTKVSDDGEVTITTDVAFDAIVMISNLSGNVKNSSYIPYSVISGPVNSAGNPLLFSYSLHSIILNTSSNIILVDGLDIVRNISSGNDLNIPTNLEPGVYVLFADSLNIINNSLNSLTYIKKDDYLGVLNSLPETNLDGQRCYVAYEKSYECINGSWATKAFTPLGEFIVTDNYVSSVITYNYRNNNLAITPSSHVLDYLFGNKIEGLDINISDKLYVSVGRCLINNKLVTVTDTIIKDYNSQWEEGQNNGCYQPEKQTSYEVKKGNINYYTKEIGNTGEYVAANTTIYSNRELTNYYKKSEGNEFQYTGNSYIVDFNDTGWGYVYLIEGNNKYDILISYNTQPVLPVGYYNFRSIGYFYKDEEGNVLSLSKVLPHKTYFYFPLEIELDEGFLKLGGSPSQLIMNIRSNDFQEIEFFINDILVDVEYAKNITRQISRDTQIVAADLQVSLLGFVDEEI